MEVTVVRAAAFRPSELARAVGARAVVWFCCASCAAAERAEPSFTTVTSTATDCTVVLAPVISLSETPRSPATALVLTTRAARLPPLVALSSRTTVKEAD